MKENKLSIVINSSIKDVFEFTINPINTHLWIDSIVEEVVDSYPISVGTQYKNHDDDNNWDLYKVIEFKENKIFTLSSIGGDYYVRYTYEKLDEVKTKMTYFEWSEKENLTKPFEQSTFDKLK